MDEQEEMEASLDDWIRFWSRYNQSQDETLNPNTNAIDHFFSSRDRLSQVQSYMNMALFVNELYTTKINVNMNAIDTEAIDGLFEALHPLNSKVLCGYLFQHGDIAFNCRNCQEDDTCVLCLTCFQNSNHEGHEVYFHQTTPGGMCDCGDTEAWNAAGFCPAHGEENQKSKKAQEQKGDSSLLPSVDLMGRALLKLALQYVAQVVKKTEQAFTEPAILALSTEAHSTEGKQFHVRIFNDDVHTDHDLVGSLTKKNIPRAHELTREIDATGSQSIKIFPTVQEAMELRDILHDEGWFVQVIEKAHLHDEKVALELVQWIIAVGKKSPLFQEIVDALLLELEHGHSIFQTLLACDAYTVKPLVLALHQLYMQVIGSSTSIKNEFARQYIVAYRHTMDLYFQGIGTQAETILNFGVQIFTTPSVVLYLAKDEGLFDIFFALLNDAVQHCASFENQVSLEHRIIKYKRYLYLMRDIEYSLNIPTMPEFVSQKPTLLDQYLMVLFKVQGIHPQIRRSNRQSHVEFEDRNWLRAFELHLNINPIAVLFVRGLCTEGKTNVGDDVMQMDSNCPERGSRQIINSATYDHIEKALRDSLMAFATDEQQAPLKSASEMSLPGGFDNVEQLVSYDILKDDVSCHYPLHHFLGRAVQRVVVADDNALMNVRTFLRSREPNKASDDKLFAFILEIPLRLFALSAQVHSELWVRNGMSIMMVQMANYFGSPTCHEMGDIDLVLLQYSALYFDDTKNMDVFFTTFFDRFNLLEWFFESAVEKDGDDMETSEDSPKKKKIMRMTSRALQRQHDEFPKFAGVAEECLLTLIWLFTELPCSAADHVHTGLRREVLHMLAEQACTHSELMDCLSIVLHGRGKRNNSAETLLLTEILKEIATFKHSDSDEPAKYELKHEYYQEYDPAFYHLSRRQHERAQSRRQEERQRLSYQKQSSLKSVQPVPVVSSPPAAHRAFAGLRQHLLHPMVFRVLRQILFHAANKTKHRTSEVLLVRGIHVLTLQVHAATQLREIDSGSDLVQAFIVEIVSGTAAPSEEKAVCIPAFLQRLLKLEPSPTQGTLEGIVWLLHTYAEFDSQCRQYIPMKAEENDAGATDDKEAALARRKRLQQEALRRMQEKQASFAMSIEGEDFEDMDTAEEEEALRERPAPTCMVCSEMAPSPLMYVAFSQRSAVYQHLDRKWIKEDFYPSTRSKSELHMNLCGHALHLSCSDEYNRTMKAREDRQLLNQELMLINTKGGEFLCPLCQMLCNTLVPYVSHLPPPVNPQDMTRVFQSKRNPAAVLEWIESLPAIFQKRYDSLRDAQPASHLREALARFSQKLIDVGSDEDFTRGPVGLSQQEQVHILWSTLAFNIRGAELTKMSRTLLSAKLNVIYDGCVFSESDSMGHNLQSDYGTELDSFSVNEEHKWNLLFTAVREVHMLYDNDKGHDDGIRFPLVNLFQADEHTKVIWQEMVVRGAPLSLYQPLLSGDILYTLIAVLSCVDNKAQSIMAIRTLCNVYLAQALLRTWKWEEECMEHADDEMEKAEKQEVEKATDSDKEIVKAICKLRFLLIKAAGWSVNEEPLFPYKLRSFVEASVSTFIRQATLICRILFRGDEPDAAEYLGFTNSLHLSTNFDEMCGQLGIPTPVDIVAHAPLIERLCSWSKQLRTRTLSSVPPHVRRAYCTGKLPDLALDIMVDAYGGGKYSLPIQGNSVIKASDNEETKSEMQEADTPLFVKNLAYTRNLSVLALENGKFVYNSINFPYSNIGVDQLLPKAYTDLHVLMSGTHCDAGLRKNPAMCLVCGAIVCAGTDCCRRDGKGACTQHAEACGYGIGVFFVLRSCAVLMIFHARSIFHASLYLDEFGEEDLNLRRGRPLFLSFKRLLNLTTLYGNHQIANEIVQKRRKSTHFIRNNFY